MCEDPGIGEWREWDGPGTGELDTLPGRSASVLGRRGSSATRSVTLDPPGYGSYIAAPPFGPAPALPPLPLPPTPAPLIPSPVAGLDPIHSAHAHAPSTPTGVYSNGYLQASIFPGSDVDLLFFSSLPSFHLFHQAHFPACV